VDWDRVAAAASQKRAIPIPISTGSSTLEEILRNAAALEH